MYDAITYSLLSALFFSLNIVLVRKSFVTVNPMKVTFVTICTAIPILGAFCAVNGDFSHWTFLDSITVVYLALAGILHFVVGRTLQYYSAKDIGASRANTLTSTHVIYAPIFGALILQEIIVIKLVIGVICIAIGTWSIFLSTASFKGQSKGFAYSLRGLVLGLAGGTVWGITPVFVRVGVLATGSALLSNLVSTLFAAVSCFALLIGTGNNKNFRNIDKSYFGYILLAGIVVCFAQIFRYYALLMGNVSFVDPIIGVNPLFTVFLSYLFIKKVEKMNLKMIIGILLLILGVYVIILT